ncbi:hypothetical protein HDU91_002885 [Kappamyces sp. JEL0680]|nr:hypothetical protein HDU91_002885 [Kappamyces sp. JEL0680]
MFSPKKRIKSVVCQSHRSRTASSRHTAVQLASSGDGPESVDLKLCTSVAETLNSISQYYTFVLYEKYSLRCLLDKILPALYNQVVTLAEMEHVDPVQTLLRHYVDNLLISIQTIEENHAKRPQQLAFLLDATVPSLDPKVQGLAHSWFLKKKQKHGVKNLATEAKSLLKNSIKELRLTEAKLQIVLWMECLRIHKDTTTEIPYVELLKRKKKDTLSSASHIKKALSVLLDKLLIWMVSLSDSHNLWKDFVLPVLIPFYEEELPDIVGEFTKKTGGDLAAAEDASLMSPLWKRKPTLAKRPKTKTGKVVRAPSNRENMEKRVSSKPVSKPRHKRALATASSKDADGSRAKPELTMEEFFTEPSHAKSRVIASCRDVETENVFIPETPAK